MLDEAAFVLMAETGEKRRQIQRMLDLQRLGDTTAEQAARETQGADVSDKTVETPRARETTAELSDANLAEIYAAGFLAQGLIADAMKGRQEKANQYNATDEADAANRDAD